MAEDAQGQITRYTFREVIEAVDVARQPGVSIAALCSRLGITPRLLKSWQSYYADVPTGLLKRLCYLQEKAEYLERELQRRDQMILGLLISELRGVIAMEI